MLKIWEVKYKGEIYQIISDTMPAWPVHQGKGGATYIKWVPKTKGGWDAPTA